MNQQLTHLYNTTAAWKSINPILFRGEFGFESDGSGFKIGDGITPWNELPYGAASDQHFTSGDGIDVTNHVISATLLYEVVDNET